MVLSFTFSSKPNGNNSHTYDNKGRIDENSMLGQYQYAATNFQQTGLDLNASGQGFYQNGAEQQISYNAFKSPVEINESGKERYSFQYNAGIGRANMFFGDTDADKEERRYHRHYSEDGSMEITWDKTTGKTVFTTYVGGDAYTAPAIFHSEQTSTTTAQYLYLHRDYLGSILAITDKDGNLKEKRHFDAWGNPVKWTNGSVMAITGGMAGGALSDRGFTGHEHLFGANLIHMNGRLYDPGLHRFLMPDNFVQNPYSTLSYNRYSYVWNNPLMYVDPSGETNEFTETPNQGWFSKILSIPIVGWATGVIGLYESFVGPINWDNVGEAIARPFREAGRWYEKNIGKPLNKWFNKHIKEPIFGGGDKSPPPKVAHPLEVPTPATNTQSNLPIFGASGGVGGMPLAHMWKNAPKQDYSGFLGKVDYYVLGGGFVDGISYDIDGNPIGLAPLMGTPDVGKGGLSLVKGFRSLWKSLKGVKSAAKSSTQGGLNLFKWGAPQTGKNVGWKTGDYMLHLPNKGTPKLNWKANYGALRREMGLGKPIFDSYRTTGGNLIPTKGFLNAERSILQGRGWIYNPSKGAWMPPGF